MSFGYQTIGSTNGVEIFHDHTIEVEDSITWTHSKHQLHAGFEFYHYIMNDVYAGNSGASGAFNFSGQYTANPGVTVQQNGQPASPAGNAFADFLLGLPQEVQQRRASQTSTCATASSPALPPDTFQATPNPILALGLRYELTTARGDKNQNNNINYDLATGQPEIGKNYNTYTGITNFRPRIGFRLEALAGRPTRRPSQRRRHLLVHGKKRRQQHGCRLPSQRDHDRPAETSSPNGYSPNHARSGILHLLVGDAAASAQLVAFAANCIGGVQAHAHQLANLRPAVDQQWNLVVEHQFHGNGTFSIGYVGNKVDHLADIYLFNQKQLNDVGQAVPGRLHAATHRRRNAGAQARHNSSDGFSRYSARQSLPSLAQRGLPRA